MDNKTKLRLLPDFTDHRRFKPHYRIDCRFLVLAILLAAVIVAAAAGGFVWTSRRQQRQFIERLKNSTSIPKRQNQRGKPAPYVPQRRTTPERCDYPDLPVAKCSVDEAHAMFKNARHVRKSIKWRQNSRAVRNVRTVNRRKASLHKCRLKSVGVSDGIFRLKR